MKKNSRKVIDEKVLEVERLMHELCKNARENIKLVADSLGDELSGLTADDREEQVAELQDDLIEATAITSNIPELIKEAIIAVDKFPQSAKGIKKVLERMMVI